MGTLKGMKWGRTLRAWLLITVTCPIGAGTALAQGLQPTASDSEDLPSIGKLLGEPTGLQFSIDWEFFESVRGQEAAAARTLERVFERSFGTCSAAGILVAGGGGPYDIWGSKFTIR